MSILCLESHHDFCNARSTSTALADYLKDVYETLDNKEEGVSLLAR